MYRRTDGQIYLKSRVRNLVAAKKILNFQAGKLLRALKAVICFCPPLCLNKQSIKVSSEWFPLQSRDLRVSWSVGSSVILFLFFHFLLPTYDPLRYILPMGTNYARNSNTALLIRSLSSHCIRGNFDFEIFHSICFLVEEIIIIITISLLCPQAAQTLADVCVRRKEIKNASETRHSSLTTTGCFTSNRTK